MDSPRRCESPEPTEEAEAGPSSPQTTLATLPLTRRASSTLQRVAETTGLVGKVVGVKVARVALSVTFPTTTAFIKDRKQTDEDLEVLVGRIEKYTDGVEKALKERDDTPEKYDEPLEELRRTTTEILDGVEKVKRMSFMQRMGNWKTVKRNIERWTRDFDDAKNMFSIRVRFPPSSIGPSVSGTSAPFSVPFISSALSSLSSNAALTYSLADFSTHIRNNEDIANIAIHTLIRRKDLKGVKHEFLIFHGTTTAGQDVWIRMERAAKQDYTMFNLKSISSVFPANDTAMVAGSLDIILVRATSEEEAVVDFTIPPLLKDLNRQLEALAIASANYSLLKENCYFFCSILQELMTEVHNGDLRVGKLANLDFGVKARKDVRALVMDQVAFERAAAALQRRTGIEEKAPSDAVTSIGLT